LIKAQEAATQLNFFVGPSPYRHGNLRRRAFFCGQSRIIDLVLNPPLSEHIYSVVRN
jgi:hypothetical protein